MFLVRGGFESLFLRVIEMCSKRKKAPLLGLIPSNGGGGGIRTLVTGSTGETVFETAAFNHSATPPQGRCAA